MGLLPNGLMPFLGLLVGGLITSYLLMMWIFGPAIPNANAGLWFLTPPAIITVGAALAGVVLAAVICPTPWWIPVGLVGFVVVTNVMFDRRYPS